MKKMMIIGSFFVLMLLTFFFLIFSGSESSETSILAGVLPISIYFGILIYYRGNITKNDIDSVYYFGFLVTLITLGIAASKFTGNNKDISLITKQFSIGLIATGLALLYRIILMTFKDEEEEDLVSLMKATNEQLDVFRQRSVAMFYEIEVASKKLSELTIKSIENTSLTHEKAQSQLETVQQKSLDIMTNSLNNSLGQVLGNLKEASQSASITITDFSKNINALSLDTSLKNLPKSLSGLNESIGGFKDKVDASLDAIKGSSKVLNDHIVILNNTLGVSDKSISEIKSNSIDVNQALNNLNLSIVTSASKFDESSEKMDQFNTKLEQISQESNKTTSENKPGSEMPDFKYVFKK